MAAEAYINYDKMIDLIQYMEERRDKMQKLCEQELLQNRVNEIRENYNGEAATSFESDVKTTTQKVVDEVDLLIEQLKKEAKVQKEAYENQDRTLAA